MALTDMMQIPELGSGEMTPEQMELVKKLLAGMGQNEDPNSQYQDPNANIPGTGEIGKGALKTGLNVGMQTGNPLIGAAAAGVGYISGKMNANNMQRRADRENEGMAEDFQRQQSQSSVYADPNSVYYSAADGAPINPADAKRMMSGGRMPYKGGGSIYKMMNNNQYSGGMEYMDGGPTDEKRKGERTSGGHQDVSGEMSKKEVAKKDRQGKIRTFFNKRSRKSASFMNGGDTDLFNMMK